jgi:hypothetical protein
MSQFHPMLKGGIDLHLHSHPSIFERKQTDWELVEDIKSADMAGGVIKSHESGTVDRAYLIRQKEPQLHVYGGLVTNHFTGGLSPAAVDVALRLGAKVIWMPTISSVQHQSYFAKKKTRFFNTERPLAQPDTGLTIFDSDGHRLLSEVHEILSLIGERDAILATGHLSEGEVIALVDAAKEHNVDKILIQHVDLGISPLPLETQERLVKQGAILEKCYLACSTDFHDISIEEMAATISHLGAPACVLVTDYGQTHNLAPVEGMSEFVTRLLDVGVPAKDIEMMLIRNPKNLLGI